MEEPEMLIIALTVLFAISAVATIATLFDAALRASAAMQGLRRMQAQKQRAAGTVTFQQFGGRKIIAANRPQPAVAPLTQPLRAAA